MKLIFFDFRIEFDVDGRFSVMYSPRKLPEVVFRFWNVLTSVEMTEFSYKHYFEQLYWHFYSDEEVVYYYDQY